MVQFILLISFAAVIGIQVGIYLSLKQRKIPLTRSLLFSFCIYILPIMIIAAHLELYRKRHLIMQSIARDKKMKKSQTERIIKELDTKKFIVLSIIMAINDLFTPKDNLILLLDIAEIYNKKVRTHMHKSILQRFGALGIVKKATQIIRGDLVTHASNQIFINEFEVKLP